MDEVPRFYEICYNIFKYLDRGVHRMERNWFAGKMPGEVSYSEIEAKKDTFHDWGFVPISMKEIGYESVNDKLRTYTVEEYEKLDDAGKEKMVDEVLAIYRSIDLLPIQYYSDLGVMNEIERCISYKAEFDGDTVSCGAGVGTTLCDYLFPNLFDTPSKHDINKEGAETMFKKFHNDDCLRRAIKFCFSYKNGCPTPTNVTGGLRLIGSAPTNFRPMNAKAVYERFCPEGGVIYDFCCVDGETEFFDGKRWKSIADYKEGDEVLQFCDDGTAEMVKPLEYIHYKSDEPFYLYENGYSMSTCLTGNHDVVLEDVYGGGGSRYYKVKMKDIVAGTYRSGAILDVPLTFRYGGDVDEDPDFIFLMLILYAMAYDSRIVRAVVLKEDVFQIDMDNVRLFDHDTDCFHAFITFIKLLFRASAFGVGHMNSKESLRVACRKFATYFTVDVNGMPHLNWEAWNAISVESKRGFWKIKDNFSPRLTDYVLSCAFPGDYDAKQFFINSIGYTTMYESDLEDEVFSSDLYGVGSYVSGSDAYQEVMKEDKYCFTVPSHMLVLRRKKKIFITGNCGFGGRMLGALSSKKNFRYVGTDPCTETMYHLHELGDYIEMVTGREDSYELHCCGSEDFHGPAESVDFAFSSPPYFDLEVYSTEETQCFNKFPVLEDWLEGYVRATIKNIHHMLKRGAVYAVNIADFNVGGGKEVAYVDEWIRISTEEGMPLYDTVFLGVTARAGSKQQAAGELKKENILIFKKPL